MSKSQELGRVVQQLSRPGFSYEVLIGDTDHYCIYVHEFPMTDKSWHAYAEIPGEAVASRSQDELFGLVEEHLQKAYTNMASAKSRFDLPAPSGATCTRCNLRNEYAAPSAAYVCYECRR